MYTNNLEQLINFIFFIATGMVLSIVFDIFRILRRSFKTSDLITNIEDVIFGIITGIIVLLSVFLFNNGELRLYIFIGLILGIVIYILFISKYFIKLNVAIINFVKRVILLVTKPFRILFNILKKIFLKPISFVIINFKLVIHRISIKVKNATKISKKTNKQEGF